MRDRALMLMASGPAVLYTCEAQGDFSSTFVSENVRHLLGHDPQQFLQDPGFWLDHIHPDDKERVLDDLRKVSGKGNQVCEYRFQHKDGSYRWMRDELRLLRDRNGEPQEIVGHWTDITDHKLAEQKLHAQRRLLTAISRAQSHFIQDAEPSQLFDDLLGDLLLLADSEYGFIGEIRYTSDGQPYLKTHAITNIAWDDATRRFYEENAPQGMEFYNTKTLFGAVMVSGEPVIANDPARDPRRGGLPEGHPHMGAFLGLPVNVGEKLVGMIGVANRPDGYDQALVDFLQPLLNTYGQIIDAYRVEQRRREVEAQIQRREVRLGAILDNVLEGIVTIHEDGIVESFNRSAEQIFDYDASEVIGRNVSMLTPEPHRGNHDRYIANYLQTGVAKIIGIGREVEGQRRDGSTFPMELGINEMWVGDKRMFTAVVRDITERKRLDKMKNEFVSVVSHELRTPLTAIHGALGLLSGGISGELPAQVGSLVDIAEKNSERLMALINDLLDMEKIISEKMVFRRDVIDILPLIRETLVHNQLYANGFGVRFSLADGAVSGRVVADRDRLAQVMANLLSNAAKFSPEGALVEVDVAREGGLICVSVLDHGPGIPEEFRGRLFEKFSQADASDTRRRGGTGLGLSICKTLVEKMGGRIGFKSVNGVGTTFYFDLPEYVGGDT